MTWTAPKADTDPRSLRRLGFQTLYQLDARANEYGASDAVLSSLENAEGFTERDRAAAFELASAAFEAREHADAEFGELAPTWPARRQAPVDRAILRLAHFELTQTNAPAKAVVNEAVELAKSFSTEKAPSFVNGLLDKVLKRVLHEREAEAAAGEQAE